MKIWTRSRRGRLTEAREVTLLLRNRDELERILRFLSKVAQLPEERWQGHWTHEHFQFDGNFQPGWPDIVVMRETGSEPKTDAPVRRAVRRRGPRNVE